MEIIVEKLIPEDYVICCAVNKNAAEELFSDDIVEFLFSTMRSNLLPLAAYKKTNIEERREERLYIAYNPKIIDRSRINQMEGEITKPSNNRPATPAKKNAKEALIDIVTDLNSCEKARRLALAGKLQVFLK